MKNVLMLSLLVFAACPMFGSGYDTFQLGVGAWVESITWSDESGFSLMLRGARVALWHDDECTWISQRKALPLVRGGVYLLTNGRGRTRRFTDLSPTNLTARASGSLGEERLLQIELEETVSHEGESEVTRFLLSSNGALLDANTNIVCEVAFPLTLAGEELIDDRNQRIEAIAQSNRLTADSERRRAQSYLEGLVRERSFVHGQTNVVDISQERSEAERLAAMTKDGKLSPTLIGLLQGAHGAHERRYKKATFYIDTNGIHLLRLEERFNTGDMRNIEFYSTGESASFVDEFCRTKMKLCYHYDKSGSLMWLIKLDKGSISEFWLREEKGLSLSTDNNTARRLMASVWSVPSVVWATECTEEAATR